ncbi:MAG: hypothetical protein QI223_06860, partial [Candidatus Korarchaeota archaeon]|nr:hypothetical protein [Candidatus Korarchaeota archaeon]
RRGGSMPKKKKERSFMPMSTAGLLSFSQEESGGLKVPKWFPVAVSIASSVILLVLRAAA